MHTYAVPMAALVTVALASPSAITLPRQLHPFLPLEVRQGNVSPGQYACHEACGETILKATGDYCDSPAWVDYYEECMSCANDYGIWKWYGDKVTVAAKQCGRDAIPDPADSSAPSAGPSSTAPPVAVSQTSSVASSTVPSPTATGTPSPNSSTASGIGGINPTITPNPTISSPTPSVSVPIAAATALGHNHMMAMGIAGIIALPAIL
ncbi:uncharacterized protein B0I36DRAFT_1110 [Microdochium trichocladiopsis]|uniref:Uncharacterized protein n=1 Tax=Microdochium trichocladiopsis TaxID=1682393 RepID=A0A9P8YFQ8_9PEZI|nr:uncharacterized protein B0I36DRAFT_1110 [Microdochium trichocladiopsis]KAH7039681.1 hypothetical protein B0I36DRAFT_1110 [Microdochium trichocladiopsis]